MTAEEEPVHGGDDETTAYDIQCRLTAQDDNGWVIVRVMLSEDGETLTVKFPGPFDTKWIITIGNFKSVAAVDEFLVRFRRVSKQLQDNECYKVIQGMTIAYTTENRRFYDAVVDAVEHQSHSLTDGKEECLCTFRLTQLEVPRYTTSVKIANICTIQATAEVDPRIISFSKLVKERILAAYLNSCVVSEHSIPALGFGGPLSYKEAICLAVNQKSSSQSRPQDTEVGSCCRKRREDKERVNFTTQRDGDEDFGIADILESQGYHFLLIDNLEKDLSTSAIRQFIHGHTHVSPQAYLFPSRSSVSSGSGAIASDSKEKIEKIYEFLVHHKHLIVSARGRPWVVSEKVLNGLCRATPGSLLPGSQDELQLASLSKELKVVHFGTEAYKIAKQLRDLFLDFVDHEQLLRKRLVLEETKILKSSQSQETGTTMAPKKDSTPKKGKSKVPKYVEDSDSEYCGEEDFPLFERPSEYKLQVPTMKKRKGSSEPSVFVSIEAQSRWEQGMGMKMLHIERGFAVAEGPFQQLVEFHHFDKKLAEAPSYCNASLAREFYANAKYPDEDGAYFVRGKRVQITSEIINAHLGTPSYPRNPLVFPKNYDSDSELLEELAIPGAEWVLNSKGVRKHIRSEWLKGDVRIWLMFVVSRLLPSSQTTEVSRKRLYLISAIRRRRSIDAGRLILSNIKNGIDADNAALYFPVLLEEICAAQGVDSEAGDWRRNPGPIGSQLYSKYLRLEKEMMQEQIVRATEPQNEARPFVQGSFGAQQAFDFQSFHGVLQGLQHSIDSRFQQLDERMESINEQADDRHQDLVTRLDDRHQDLVTRLDDMSSIAQQQFEVLYHRQLVMQMELDKCNKMAVYYHSAPGPPKPTPTSAALAGYRVPNLSMDEISGEVHERPPGVQSRASFPPLPTFGRIPQGPPTPTFCVDQVFMPATRIPMFGTGQPLQGPIHGHFHWTAQPFSGASFSTTASFSSPFSSAPTSSQGAPHP